MGAKINIMTRLVADLAATAARPVSAGEVARELGISRNTAARYLERALRAGLVERQEFMHFNGQRYYGYWRNRDE